MINIANHDSLFLVIYVNAIKLSNNYINQLNQHHYQPKDTIHFNIYIYIYIINNCTITFKSFLFN